MEGKGLVMRIDSHQHFWKLNRGDYDWLTPRLDVLYRDYLPADLHPYLIEHNIDYTVLVQAAPTVAETKFMLKLYDEHEFIAGVVGWLDLESDHFKDQFYRFRENRGFVGIRPMLQDLEDDQWILRPKVMKHLEILIEVDFPIDLLVFPRHLPYIIELLEHLPELKAVINHGAKPNIARGVMEPWKEYLAQIGSYSKVMCKLSGLITEADHQNWKTDDLVPYVHHIIDVFGPKRVLFGSDWPVCLLAGSYSNVYKSAMASIPKGLMNEDLKAIFGENAAQFYQL